ncbi:hypothetical protein H097_12998 [Pseudomonas sp. FH4]|uniref:hypothetical protein n=1 Tax=Pseudomonas fluorescens group TaxID=136843 RepID=UPI0003DD638C|nr:MULTISPECIES: hypothetical protein [Pseudomonas fluorescens group]ETK18223.1 hypothetical protein H097_12998 [Pseudomonas sp. FH4]MBF8007140.1 hypothetical protein [Pseudomonas brenneri]
MGETDTPDFNKARGYLIGFSTVVLLLWYFGADLSAFKLLGNEVKLKENVQNVWMVLAGINAYLWVRLYQRTPEGSFRFDVSMHDLYEKTLISVVKHQRRKKMRAHVLELFEQSPGTVDGDFKLISFNPKGRMTHYDKSPPKSSELADRLAMLRKLHKTARNEICYSFYIHYKVGDSEHHLSGGQTYPTTPSLLTATLVKGYVFARGVIVSPWFFDHVTPFVLGGLGVGVALFNWWQINYPQA